MFGSFLFGVFGSAVAIVIETALLSAVIASAANRPVGMTRAGPIVVVAFLFDTLMQAGLFFVPQVTFPVFPVSLVIWAVAIVLLGQLRLGESAMAAVVLTIANRLLAVLLILGVLTLHLAP